MPYIILYISLFSVNK